MTVVKPDRAARVRIAAFDFDAMVVLAPLFALLGGLAIWRANDPTDYVGAGIYLSLAVVFTYRLVRRYRI